MSSTILGDLASRRRTSIYAILHILPPIAAVSRCTSTVFDLISEHTLISGHPPFRCTVYHGTAAICISIELYEIVQLRSGDGEALPLTLSLTVGVVGLMLTGGPLIRSNLY